MAKKEMDTLNFTFFMSKQLTTLQIISSYKDRKLKPNSFSYVLH